jgi:hypothetical protein
VFQSVPDTASFTVECAGPDATTPGFSLYAANTAAWSAGEMGNVAAALEAVLVADVAPVLPTDHTIVRVVVRDLEAQFGLVVERPAINQLGAVASPSLPAEVAVRGTWLGTPGAPPSRGGLYTPPPAESQVVGSILQAAPLAAWEAAMTAMAGAMDTGTATHVIVSRYSGTALVALPDGQTVKRPVKRAAGVTNTVTGNVVGSVLASQKKRRPAA